MLVKQSILKDFISGNFHSKNKFFTILFRIPWLEWPLIYDIRARPYQIKSDTGTKDLQMVDLGLRILYRPNASQIPWLAKNIGLSMSDKNGKNHNISLDYDEKVLPSITHETLKSVIANFDASSLLTKRNEVRCQQTCHQIVNISLGVAQNQR